MRIVLLTGQNTRAQTFLMSKLVILLVHGTCLDYYHFVSQIGYKITKAHADATRSTSAIH